MSSRTIAAHAAAINAGELEPLDGEDLACLGMRRADPDPWDFFRELKDFSALTAAAAPNHRQRKPTPTLARLVGKAKQVGVDVTVEPNGAVTFRTSNSSGEKAMPSGNPFDQWMAKKVKDED